MLKKKRFKATDSGLYAFYFTFIVAEIPAILQIFTFMAFLVFVVSWYVMVILDMALLGLYLGIQGSEYYTRHRLNEIATQVGDKSWERKWITLIILSTLLVSVITNLIARRFVEAILH